MIFIGNFIRIDCGIFETQINNICPIYAQKNLLWSIPIQSIIKPPLANGKYTSKIENLWSKSS